MPTYEKNNIEVQELAATASHAAYAEPHSGPSAMQCKATSVHGLLGHRDLGSVDTRNVAIKKQVAWI